MKGSLFRAFTLIELLVVMAIMMILAGMMLPGLKNARDSAYSAKCMNSLKQLSLANQMFANENEEKFALASGPDPSYANLTRWYGVRTTSSTPFVGTNGMLSPYLGPSKSVRECGGMRSIVTGGFEVGCGGYGYNQSYVGGLPGDWTNEQYQRRTALRGIEETTVMFTDAAMAISAGIIEYSFAEPPYPDYGPGGGGIQASPGDPSVHFRHPGKRANVAWCDGHVSSEKMTATSTTANFYGGVASFHNIGWFGPLTSNAFWRVP